MPHPAAGIGRERKLLDSAAFKQVFDRRQSAHGRYFSYHGTPNQGPVPRLGLTVSKRVSKKAVERNRLKRIIRESFRHKQLKIGAVDVVVVCKVGAAAQPNTVLRAELDDLWHRLHKKMQQK